jgi:ATP-dependent RNA helicase DDX41
MKHLRDADMEETMNWDDNDDAEPLYVPLAKRREVERKQTESRRPINIEAEEEERAAAGPRARKSLLELALELKEERDALANEVDVRTVRKQEEEHLLEAVTEAKPLMAVGEIAKGVHYASSITSTWTAPAHIREMTHEQAEAIRKMYHIIVEGEDVPNPITSFADCKFPRPILQKLVDKGIRKPTPIQIQGMSVVLGGRDMIGVAFTGSGKTLVFVLPLVMMAFEEEMRMPLVPGEGPIGLIICPSRELARQTHQVMSHYCEGMAGTPGWPALHTACLIGGIDMREQSDSVRSGVHGVVATPGRLIDFLTKKRINLNSCKFLVLDEADRMVDMGFEDEVRQVFDFFKHQRQTLLFSATMPRKVQKFAETALVRHVVVNVGRAGAANLDVIQEVEYVKQEAKIVYLLECLQKTPPPVLIFCENKADVDDIHEYLLLKCVDAVSIHGGKSQEEREFAIKAFKSGTKDVLVATDIAGKGLDFPDVQHVINYDMPKEIENYVHRIGRTGRCGKTGLATTFINKVSAETTLLDLKHLLIEAKQRIPPFLRTIHDPREEEEEIDDGKGCSYCGGLGHRITTCPKLEKTRDRTLLAGGSKDFLSGRSREGGGGGET